MNAYGLLELAIVGLVVGISAWSVVRPWLRRRNAVASDAGCGNKTSSCGGCSGCSNSTSKEQPIRFHH